MRADDPTRLTPGNGNVISVIQGQYKVSADPNAVMSTILGSCVSVALFDPDTKMGGLNHFLLPTSQRADDNSLKYGAMANELLINALLKRGAIKSRLRAKLFGGANIVASLGEIGSRNAQFAREYMLREGITVDQADVGGSFARRVQFHPATGQARVFKVSTGEGQTVARSERAPAPRARPSEVTLF